MATRCQVRIAQEGLQWKQTVLLYRHCDGYPETVIPAIQKAYDLMAKLPEVWMMGRAGKAAAALITADFPHFEAQEEQRLYKDIEWFYVLHLVNRLSAHLQQKVEWYVSIYTPTDRFWDAPCIYNLELLICRRPIQGLANFDTTGKERLQKWADWESPKLENKDNRNNEGSKTL